VCFKGRFLLPQKGGFMATKKVYRNSENGQFVPPKYVKEHPRTTETERRPTKRK